MPPPALRSTSKFTPFSLALANGGIVAGIASIPPATTPASPITRAAKPLVILLHGGKCTPYHFDISPSHSYSVLSDPDSLAIPVVAIHRPGYGYSTSFLPAEDEADEKGEVLYHLETARWLHESIFPALWEEFGVSNHCGGVVALGHSMGGIQLVVTAGLYARDVAAKYPLRGIIVSGMGCRFISRAELREGFTPGETLPDEIFYRNGAMELLMLNERSLGLCDADIYERIAEMDVGMPREELLSLLAWWPVHWREFAGDVTVPVLYGLGEFDWLWETSSEHVAEFREAFGRCQRWEGGLVKGAPHCIEWSRVGGEWVKRVGDWAVDVVKSGGKR